MSNVFVVISINVFPFCCLDQKILYSNLSVSYEDTGGHHLTTWIRGKEFRITKRVVFEVLGSPLVRRPTYPYTESPLIDDVMSLLCGKSVTWGSEPRLNSSVFTELNYLYLRIAYHNIFSISHIHTIPLDICAFLYAFVTDGSMCFSSLFIQTIVEIYRSKSKAQKLFFPVFIYRVLNFLRLEDFPTLELVHIIAPIGAIFLRQQQTQKKSVEPSTGTSKRPRGKASTTSGDQLATAPTSGDQLATEEVHVDPITAMDPTGDDDIANPIVAPPLSLCNIMETFMTTQVAYEQLIDELLTMVAAFRADFAKYRIAFPPPPLFNP